MTFCNDVLQRGNDGFESIKNKSKKMFYMGSEHKQVIDYSSIKLEQRSDFSIKITQKGSIDNI